VWSRSAFERFSLFLEIVSGFLEEAPDEVVSNLARNGPRSARARSKLHRFRQEHLDLWRSCRGHFFSLCL
jgi:hypothetical protein